MAECLVTGMCTCTVFMSRSYSTSLVGSLPLALVVYYTHTHTHRKCQREQEDEEASKVQKEKAFKKDWEVYYTAAVKKKKTKAYTGLKPPKLKQEKR